MSETRFSDLPILPEIKRAIEQIGFETATEIQAKSLPAIISGQDVIGKSQTGTGKTVAFGIPALESLDTKDHKSSVQVLILCPTRELACQACGEIKKLSQFMHGVRAVEIYGGVPMDRQIVRLKKANIVIGTPGRIMDHLRRKTLKLHGLKMIVLDEADEMLNMGFKEDVETILTDAPEDRQTVLFSATMPPAIMSITKQFQTDPILVEVSSKKVTLNNIEQLYLDAPMGKKMDILNLVLRYHKPVLTMIFCNTKRMVDDITEYLCQAGFTAVGLHGDMKQSQRTKIMDGFKTGRAGILVATDVAARGIDVNNIDYVINYDIPQNNEYYVHRIGRTGRAGKTGRAITICSGRRQLFEIRDIARRNKAEINELQLPTMADIQEKTKESNYDIIKNALDVELDSTYVEMVSKFDEEGIPPEKLAGVLLQMKFGQADKELLSLQIGNSGRRNNRNERGSSSHDNSGYKKIMINIGRAARVAPNHIVGAITEQTNLAGNEIGKIEIYDNHTIVGIPNDKIDDVLFEMANCKICGKPTTSVLAADNVRQKSGGNHHRSDKNYRKDNNHRGGDKNRSRRSGGYNKNKSKDRDRDRY